MKSGTREFRGEYVYNKPIPPPFSCKPLYKIPHWLSSIWKIEPMKITNIYSYAERPKTLPVSYNTVPVIYHNKDTNTWKYSKKHYYSQHVVIWVLQTNPAPGLADESCPPHVSGLADESCQSQLFNASAHKHIGNQQHSETISLLALHDRVTAVVKQHHQNRDHQAIQLETSLFTVSCVMTRRPSFFL